MSKRPHEEEEEEDDWVGPRQDEIEPQEEEEEKEEAPKSPTPEEKEKLAKKLKNEQLERLYLTNLPSAENYERSFMHRETITHLIVTQTDFIVTGSVDGHVKFWKKQDQGIEFVKHFRSHLGQILDMCDNFNGTLLCTVASDKAFKIFDVVNFDMINMVRLDYVPLACCFIHSDRDPISSVCISDKDSSRLLVYDAKGTSQPLRVIDKMHRNPVHLMKFNAKFEIVVSADKNGMLEYWTGTKHDYKFPKCVTFQSKMDTDLYEFVKLKTSVINMVFSRDGKQMATYGKDRKIRIFSVLSGKITQTIDDSIDVYSAIQQVN